MSTLTLRGGTDASFAPPIGYLQLVLLPTLQRLMGPAAAGLSLRLVRRGFYPKGGGEAVLQVSMGWAEFVILNHKHNKPQ